MIHIDQPICRSARSGTSGGDVYVPVHANDLPEAEMHFGTFGDLTEASLQVAHGVRDSLASSATKPLALVLTLSVGLFLAQLGSSWVFSSRSVLSDAVHTLSDLAPVSLSLIAARSRNWAKDRNLSYGYARADTVGGNAPHFFFFFFFF